MTPPKVSVVLGLTIALTVSGACRVIDEEPGGVCVGDSFGCVEIPKGEPLVLGTILDITGPRREVGRDSRNGAELAADYVDGSFDGKAGKLLGHPVTFQHKDERCAPGGGKYGARELVDRRNDYDVVAVIGTTCDAGGLGIADKILSEEAIPLLSPSITRPIMTDQEREPFFFRFAHNAALETEALARFARNELNASYAVVTDSEYETPEYSNLFAESFQELGGRVVRMTIPRENEEIDRVVTEIAESDRDVDVVFLFADPQQAFKLGQALRKRSTRLLTAASTVPPASDERVGIEGMFVATPDLAFEGRFYERKFLPAYRERFGEPLSGYHAHAFDATRIVLRAIEQVAILDDHTLLIPRTALRDAIAGTRSYEGIAGILTCNKLGDCNPAAAMLVNEVRQEGLEPVWRSGR